MPSRARRRDTSTAAAAARVAGSAAHPQQTPRSTSMESWSHAPERGVDVGISRPEPVAECRPDQLARRRRRRAFYDEMLAIEEVRRVFRIRRHRMKTWERRKHGVRPLPPVADDIVHAPGAAAGRMRAGRLRIPAREIEDAVLR